MFKSTLILLLLSGAAQADVAALRQCRALPDPPARLACYDALPLTEAVIDKPSGSTPAAEATATASTFGLRQPQDTTLEIGSHIPGLFEGWEAGSRIRLANGQLWQVSDDSRGVYNLRDPKVTVRRAAMGTFLLDIEGARRQPRVRRLE